MTPPDLLPAPPSPLPALLRGFSWREWRHHAGRHAVAALAVALGVALAFSVHLINQSALGEFGAAVRHLNGQPDLSLRGAGGAGFDETLYARVAAQPQVAHASPVVEAETYALDAAGQRRPLHVLGLDALVAAPLAPALLPQPAEGADRLDVLAPDTVALNAAAQQALGLRPGDTLRLQSGPALQRLRVVGSVAAGGAPLAVMDIAGAQALFGLLGRLTRIDLQFAPGAVPRTVLAALALPPGVRAVAPDEAAGRVSNVSRAYRVNLTVLALVALFTGAFLVFSILSLSVAKRQQQFALLGVLGLTARERLLLVLAESALLGVLASALGLAGGTLLAGLALRLLGGDLGGGYFAGLAPSLQFSWGAAAIYGALGVGAALAGAWLPARAMQRLPPAQALKGAGLLDAGPRPGSAARAAGPALLLLGAALALLPPVGGVPLFAYLSVATLLVGGLACVPAAVGAVLVLLAPLRRHPVGLLAIERARRMRHNATFAVAGVVVSLSLAVALTVMVASFRDAVGRWLDVVLPADLYARTATHAAATDSAFLPPALVRAIAALPQVTRLDTLRLVLLDLDPARPPVALIARPLDEPQRMLPLVGPLAPAQPGEVAVYVSEAMVDLYGARIGRPLRLPLGPGGAAVSTRVRGVWRDYARQHGAVMIDAADFVRLSGDTRVNDLALWLREDARTADVQQAVRRLAPEPALIEFAEPREIRATSLRLFDRSFAVTYWLQAVAIGIGLFGIAASFSAQVLARRKEFGLLAHLGFTRAQVLAVVGGEGAALTGVGALLGLLLGLAVSVVLVHVVNPQSFHWTMELRLPWGRLALLCAGVVAAGTLTAFVAGRAAAGRAAVLAVREDW